jgi:hypothetical protein
MVGLKVRFESRQGTKPDITASSVRIGLKGVRRTGERKANCQDESAYDSFCQQCVKLFHVNLSNSDMPINKASETSVILLIIKILILLHDFIWKIRAKLVSIVLGEN